MAEPYASSSTERPTTTRSSSRRSPRSDTTRDSFLSVERGTSSSSPRSRPSYSSARSTRSSSNMTIKLKKVRISNEINHELELETILSSRAPIPERRESALEKKFKSADRIAQEVKRSSNELNRLSHKFLDRHYGTHGSNLALLENRLMADMKKLQQSPDTKFKHTQMIREAQARLRSDQIPAFCKLTEIPYSKKPRRRTAFKSDATDAWTRLPPAFQTPAIILSMQNDQILGLHEDRRNQVFEQAKQDPELMKMLLEADRELGLTNPLYQQEQVKVDCVPFEPTYSFDEVKQRAQAVVQERETKHVQNSYAPAVVSRYLRRFTLLTTSLKLIHQGLSVYAKKRRLAKLVAADYKRTGTNSLAQIVKESIRQELFASAPTSSPTATTTAHNSSNNNNNSPFPHAVELSGSTATSQETRPTPPMMSVVIRDPIRRMAVSALVHTE